MKVATVGIGNVGLPFAAVLAQYYDVIGIDINPKWISDLQKGIELTEPEVNTLLQSGKITFTTDTSEVKNCKFVFVVVGTQGVTYSPDNVLSAIESIKNQLVEKSQILVIVSTIKPGAMHKFILPLLERTGIKERIQGVIYNPAMLALGQAVTYFKNPRHVFIGEEDTHTGAELESFYSQFLPSETKYFHSSFANIEVVKFAANFALINKISMLNTLTEFCEHYNADIDFITKCLQEDERLAGKKMWKGGLGYGGTCFPVDARAFQDSQLDAMIDPVGTQAIMTINQRQINRVVALIRKLNRQSISILGITYKENTHLTTESQALEIAKKLAEDKRVLVYDPGGLDNARKILGGKVLYTEDIQVALDFGEIIFVAVEWQQILSAKVEELPEDKILVDSWRVFKNKKLKCKYIALGVGV